MIIIKLIGGLGNQMFQYAMGRAIAYQRKDILKFDISNFSNDPLRKYSLSHFNIQESLATSKDLKKILNPLIREFPWTLTKRFYNFFPYYKRPLFLEQSFCYDKNVFRARSNVIFSGYWQSEKYFKQIEMIIRNDFTLKNKPDKLNNEISKIMQDTNSVSIHIRRGDYIANPITFQYHGLCSMEYYKKAIQYINENINRPIFFFFSDEIDWVKDNLKIPKDCYFIDHNKMENDYLDLWLMSQCKHNIIANSSFSWWGAWLNTNKEKIVIAPKKWFNNAAIDTTDLIPEEWLII